MRTLVAIAAMLLFAAAASANDLGLTVDPVEQEDGSVTVSYRVENPWTPRLEETLLRGMPATVTYEVGVWKRRALWFDKLVLALKSEHRVVYSPWEEAFRLRSGSRRGKPRAVPSLDSLNVLLFSERRLALAAVGSLEPGASYYVSVRVTIRPLSAEDLDEVEDWLSGEVKNADQPERGVPGYLLGIAVNLSGLGDRTALARSEPFRAGSFETPQ
ncbi:MAG TPA: DUF4390 domain-containing protein [Candidatus Saccharimonadales bacterium]|nr:DUF4390 domain-containing protein [Candidatus Saccharimonadales bacterium]